jgi:hypothetical protein
MIEQKREVTAADCVREIDEHAKTLNPYQRELFYQRLERAFKGGPKHRRKTNVIYPDFGRRNDPATLNEL